MKPNQVVAPAHLHPIPVVGEPFECVIVDCVGPLPSTKYGYQFLLTLMYVSILLPQAIPLWKNPNHYHHHLAYKKWCRLTKELIFWSQLSNNLYSSWVSLTLHPEHITQSQGTIEHWHQILKPILQKDFHDMVRARMKGFILFSLPSVM